MFISNSDILYNFKQNEKNNVKIENKSSIFITFFKILFAFCFLNFIFRLSEIYNFSYEDFKSINNFKPDLIDYYNMLYFHLNFSIIFLLISVCFLLVFKISSYKNYIGVTNLAIFVAFLSLCMFAFSVYTYNKYEVLDNVIKTKYNRTVASNEGFENSDVGMSYKKLMGMNDYKGLSSLFKDNGDIEGISSSEVFNTLLMIDKINNPSIKEHFLLEYKDKYITKNEYKIIKEEIKNYLLESQKKIMYLNNF